MKKRYEIPNKESSEDLFADVFQTKADHSALLEIFENAKSKSGKQNDKDDDDVGIMSDNDSSDSDDFVTVVPDKESVTKLTDNASNQLNKVGVYIFKFNHGLKEKR